MDANVLQLVHNVSETTKTVRADCFRSALFSRLKPGRRTLCAKRRCDRCLTTAASRCACDGARPAKPARLLLRLAALPFFCTSTKLRSVGAPGLLGAQACPVQGQQHDWRCAELVLVHAL